MKPDRHFDFIVDKNRNSMTIRRVFKAGRQLVWDCHTRSEYLDQWFAPKPMTTKTKSMDFREGGHWHFAMIMPDGTEYWVRMDYQTIRPNDGYHLLDGFSDSSGALDPAMPLASWDITFSDAPGGTLVRNIVTYASAEDLEKVMAMGMQEGMTSTLERLDELLRTLTGG